MHPVDKDLFDKYIHQIRKPNRGYNKGYGRAPHKPILLLAIIELISKGLISSNRIFITGDLILSFRDIFQKLVTTGHNANFALPFFHMRSEPFWYIVNKPGMAIPMTSSSSIKSFKKLEETIAFAEIDRELFNLFLQESSRNAIIQFILQEYFNKSELQNVYESSTEIVIRYEILNEPTEVYQQQILTLKGTMSKDDFQEEIFIRGGIFKKTVPQIYNYTCCISGMKIMSNSSAQMIDACHIIPFSISNDDTIPNGLSLSPNMHRAFDRGLITINKDYVVRVSRSVEENKSAYSLSQFDGKQINLPTSEKWYPSPEALIWHNKEVYII